MGGSFSSLFSCLLLVRTMASGFGDGGSKRARLAYVGRSSHVTVRGKDSIMRGIKESGMPSAISARSISRAKREEANRESPPYGTLMQTRMFAYDDGEKAFPVEHPLAMFAKALASSARFARNVLEALERGPPTEAAPWHATWYCNEIKAGQVLRVDNRRVVQCAYWSMYELGP